MDWGIAALLTAIIGGMLFIIQRAEAKKRLIVILIVLVVFELVRRYVWFRSVHGEALVAVSASVLINFLFWVLIGRYNPVGSSDRIQVLGMDD